VTQTTETYQLQRVRVVYARQEALRYISHLDMKLVWERTLRRAGLPLAYSQGFNPNPRLHMAAALPLGFLSQFEIADFWLETPPGSAPVDTVELVKQVREAAPPGLEIRQAEIVSLQAPVLQTQVHSASYTAIPLNDLDIDRLDQAIKMLLSAPSLPRQRRGKPYDLRPLIDSLDVCLDQEQGPIITMRLAAREGATGRPDEVLDAMGLDPANFRIERTALILLNPANPDSPTEPGQA